MADVKGVQLKAAIMFLRNRFGEQAVNAAIEALRPEDSVLLPPVLLDSNWYPFSVWRAVRRLSRTLTAEPGAGFAIDMGKFMAQYAFTGVYKSLLTNDPIKQVEKFSWINDLFYRDTRKVETTILGKSSCVVRYRYEPGVKPTRSTCASSMGLWIRTLELSGASSVKATHDQCLIDGKESCEFLLEWK